MDDRDRGMTVADAAVQLGISKEAVRKRVHRGTLSSYRDADGTVRVNLQPSSTASSTELVDELRDRIAYLERQIEEANIRDRENRRLLAAALERVPELPSPEPSRTPAESEATQEPDPEPGTPTEDRESDTQRGFWRRLFGR